MPIARRATAACPEPAKGAPVVPASVRSPALVDSIDGQSAEQLGVEVGGFLRHHFAGQGNVADLGHAARIHQESDISVTLAVPHLRQSLVSVAEEGNILR